MSTIVNLFQKQEQAVTLGLLGMQLYVPSMDAIIIDPEKPDEIAGTVNLPTTIATYIEKIALNSESKHFKQVKEQGEEEIRKYFRKKLKYTLKSLPPA